MASLTGLFSRSLNRWERSCLTYATRCYGTRRESKQWKQKPNRKPRLAIILTQDVYKLGVKGQIVKVKHGYGRNHLLPQGMAVYATPDNIKQHNAFEATKGSSTGNEVEHLANFLSGKVLTCLLYTSPSPRDATLSRMPSSA